VTTEERRAALEAIASEVRVCERCRLSGTRTHAVPGEGDPDTEVVFVGEGPGQNEDRLGRPFVGAAGDLLRELISLVGWKREEVFITNVVKCRPPGNRDPEPDEMAACRPYLVRQLEALDPALIVTLGRFSLQTFMPGDTISRVHGTARPVDSATGARAATGFAMYHPAAALRQASLHETMQRDMAAIPETLLLARAARAQERVGIAITPEAPAAHLAAPSGGTTAAVEGSEAPGLEAAALPPVTVATGSPSAPDLDVPPADQLGLF
jgi:DNA polymerase